MAHFVDSLKSLVTKQMVSKAATTVDEKESHIEQAVGLIIPSLLAVLLKKKGHSPQVENTLREAGNLNILSQIENLCEEKPTEDQRRIGDDFLQLLLGDKAADFTDPIAEQTGISKVATNRLISMIAPIVVGYLGYKLVSEEWTKAQLFDEIETEKTYFVSVVPRDLIKAFGLETQLGIVEAKTSNKHKGWMSWLALLILVLLLLWGWRTCSQRAQAADSVTSYELRVTSAQSIDASLADVLMS